MTDAVSPPAAKAKSSFAEFLDSLSKTTVVALFAIYVFGFLVVSIYDASYGFSEVDPLKPKIVAAGTLFLVFVLMPAVSARQLFWPDKDLTTEQRVSHALVRTYVYFVACIGLASFLSTLYVVNPVSPFSKYRWWLIASVGLGVVSFLVISEHGKKSYLTRPGRTSLVAALALVASVIFYYYSGLTSVSSRVALWFFGIGIVTALVESNTNSPEKRKAYNWNALVGLIVFALAIFPWAIYPEIKAAWGGGSPTPTVVYFSLDSRILPGQQMKAELLDESGAGIYVLRSGDNHALFIPRGAVSALFFSSDELPEELLKAPSRPPQLQPGQVEPR